MREMVFNEGNKKVVETCFWPPDAEKTGIVPSSRSAVRPRIVLVIAQQHFGISVRPSIAASQAGQQQPASQTSQSVWTRRTKCNERERREAQSESRSRNRSKCALQENTRRNEFVFCPAGGRALMVWVCECVCVCLYDAVEKAGHFCVRTLRPRTCMCVCVYARSGNCSISGRRTTTTNVNIDTTTPIQ